MLRRLAPLAALAAGASGGGSSSASAIEVTAKAASSVPCWGISSSRRNSSSVSAFSSENW